MLRYLMEEAGPVCKIKLDKMKNRILKGWTFVRALYLLAGLTILISSSMENQWLGIIAGIYFSAMGLFAFGCASGNCFVPSSKVNRESEDIQFTEIK